MINKDNVYIISSNVDDSIKSVSSYLEVYIFKTFREFEEYIDITPITASMIIVNSNDLPFTNTSMNRLSNVINSSFVSLDILYYMVDDEVIKKKVEEVIKKNHYTNIKCLYSKTLYAKDVADVLSGESLFSKETVTEIRTYRMRAEDYVLKRDKNNLSYEDDYITDEDELSGISDVEIPENLRESDDKIVTRLNICSDNDKERCTWVFLKAQYLSLSNKVLVLEKDIEYHTLLDMVTKTDVDYEFYDISDFYRDCSDFLNRIRNSKDKLIIVGSISRIKYNYDIVLNILVSNLDDDIDYYIYESNLNQVPYGMPVDIVISNTIPDIFKSINNLTTISNFKDITFIGLEINNLGNVSLSEKEFKNILCEMFEYNDIKSVVVKTNGLLLRKEIGLGGIFMHNESN